MFPQEQAFETPSVDGLHDAPKKFGKRRHDLLYAFVVWVVQDSVIEVTHQVEQALLLRAWNRVVGRVEIRYQNPLEPIQSALHQAPFACLRVKIDHFAERGKNPDVSRRAVQSNSCFICMNHAALYHFSEDLLSGFPVVFSPALLEPTHDNFVHLESEESIQSFSDRTLGDAELNDL